jgi:hypothetical protein
VDDNGANGFSGTVTLNSSQNGITSYSIVNPGKNYSPSKPPTLKGVTGCTLAASYTYGYQMTGVTLGAHGDGYTTAPTVTIQAPTSPAGGLPPTVTDSLGAFDTGTITGITVTNGGSGYISPPDVVFTGGGGTGATATASIGSTGKIDAITLTNAGSGYTSNPTVTISDPTGSGAAIQARAGSQAALGRVYLLTALAVAPGGSKTMTQMEVATAVRLPVTMPGALTIDAPSPNVSPGSSNNYVINGNDANSCGQTPVPVKVSVGVTDNPNNPTTPTAVACVTSVLGGAPNASCPASSGVKSSNYVGAQASPDVQNVWGSLGDLTTPSGCDALATAIVSQVNYTYPSNPSSIHLGSYPNDCPTTVVNGDLTLTGGVHGCGVLLVQGNLTMQGDYQWDGPVFVIGWGGSFTGGGGGNGVINGSLFVAQDKTPPVVNADGTITNPNGTIRATLGQPTVSFQLLGGGGNGINYDHCKSDNMLSNLNLMMPPSNQPLKVLSVRSIY